MSSIVQFSEDSLKIPYAIYLTLTPPLNWKHKHFGMWSKWGSKMLTQCSFSTSKFSKSLSCLANICAYFCDMLNLLTHFAGSCDRFEHLTLRPTEVCLVSQNVPVDALGNSLTQSRKSQCDSQKLEKIPGDFQNLVKTWWIHKSFVGSAWSASKTVLLQVAIFHGKEKGCKGQQRRHQHANWNCLGCTKGS